MNKDNFENMIKKYADELIKMSKEKVLPDAQEDITDTESEETVEEQSESDFIPFEQGRDVSPKEETPENPVTENEVASNPTENEMTDYANFSARVFTGNNAYPIENAKVLVVKDDSLYTFLTTDKDGTTKKVRLPAFPESNSLNPESDKKSVKYTGEIYATGFTPRKGLLISAVGGSDVVLDVQMTPISEREV